MTTKKEKILASANPYNSLIITLSFLFTFLDLFSLVHRNARKSYGGTSCCLKVVILEILARRGIGND